MKGHGEAVGGLATKGFHFSRENLDIHPWEVGGNAKKRSRPPLAIEAMAE